MCFRLHKQDDCSVVKHEEQKRKERDYEAYHQKRKEQKHEEHRQRRKEQKREEHRERHERHKQKQKERHNQRHEDHQVQRLGTSEGKEKPNPPSYIIGIIDALRQLNESCATKKQ
jgi:outer membrane biosynthesis protein TonB